MSVSSSSAKLAALKSSDYEPPRARSVEDRERIYALRYATLIKDFGDSLAEAIPTKVLFNLSLILCGRLANLVGKGSDERVDGAAVANSPTSASGSRTYDGPIV